MTWCWRERERKRRRSYHKAIAAPRACKGLSGHRLFAGVWVCVRAALGCVDALQSASIVPIVEKVRGLIKNVWSPDISHRASAASRDGRGSESSATMGAERTHVHVWRVDTLRPPLHLHHPPTGRKLLRRFASDPQFITVLLAASFHDETILNVILLMIKQPF